MPKGDFPITPAMSTNNELKVLHDRLLKVMPEGGTHDRASCPMCALEDVEDHATDRGGLMPETFTQDEMDAAIAAAVEPLQKRLAELDAQAKETEVGQAIAKATAELETKIAELQNQLDSAVAGQTAAETKLDETEKYWAKAIADAEAAETLAKTKEERTAAAKDTGALPDEYIEANADRFAAMSAEDFEARIAEWKVVAEAAKKPATDSKKDTEKAPGATALQAAADERKSASNLSFLSQMRRDHIDPRTLGGVG